MPETQTDTLVPPSSAWHRQLALPLVAFLGLTVGAYWISMSGPMQFDDFTVIRNISDENPWNLCRGPRRIIPNITFALNHIIHGKSTFGYHFTNAVIHGLAGLGLYFFVLQLPIASERRQRLAWAAGLTFTLHPLATQSVAYICQRYSSLAGLFALWALMCYAKGRRKKSWSWLCASGVLAVAAMLSKEYVVVLLPLVIVLEFFLFAPKEKSPLKSQLPGILLRASCILPATLLFLWLYVYSAPPPAGTATVKENPASHTKQMAHSFADWGGKTISRSGYMRTQWKVIPTTYLRLLFFPVGQSVDHPYSVSENWKDGKAWGWAVILALLLGSAFAFHRKWPLPAFGTVVIYFTLAPTSTLVPNTEFVQEQRAYLAIAGFSLILGTLMSIIPAPRFRIMLGIYLVILGSLTVYRNSLWNDSLALWQDAALRNQTSARVFNAIGSIYMRQQKYAEAEVQFRKALDVKPGYLPAMYSLPFSLFLQGKHDDCIRPFLWRLKRDPQNIHVIYTLGHAFLLQGDLKRARITMNQALKINPNHTNAAITLIDIQIKSNEFDSAEAACNRLLKQPLATRQQKIIREYRALIRQKKQLDSISPKNSPTLPQKH